jgi:uncharacterized damage-inducible protein DinB
VNTLLVEFFRHNLWSNLRLLDLCAGLGDEQLRAAAPGPYGTVQDTLVHLLAAEQRYVTLLTGAERESPLHESGGFPGVAALRDAARWSGEALIEAAGRARPSRILRGVRRGRPYALPVAVPLLQAINHATEHRTQVVGTLSPHGIEPPAIDGWAFERELVPHR